MCKKILIFALFIILSACSLFGSYYEPEAVGIGKDINELKLSPCACMQIEVIKDEINNIKENEPYTYRFILDDDVETKELHENLHKEIKDYEGYKNNLKKELSRFNIVEGCDA